MQVFEILPPVCTLLQVWVSYRPNYVKMGCSGHMYLCISIVCHVAAHCNALSHSW